MKKVFEWSHDGREQLRLELELNGNIIISNSLSCTGCLAFLKRTQEIKKLLNGPISSLPDIKGNDHSSVIWREMIAQIKEEWKSPIKHEELCHCRKVSAKKVDMSIIYGARTIEDVRQRTSANTGCGTCKDDVEALIKLRLKAL